MPENNRPIVPVILCGGSGTRLWPFSREKSPKQFHPLLTDFSLLQETLKRILTCTATDAANIITVTNDSLHMATVQQLAEIEPKALQHIINEPVGRNTAAAIAYATLYAQQHFGADTILWIVPSDHHVEDTNALTQALQQAAKTAQNGYIVTFGITPTKPETGYGYIKSGKVISAEDSTLNIEKFVEKPDTKTAESYLQEGNYLWNSGMFVATVSTLLSNFMEHAPQIIIPLHNSLSDKKNQIDIETYQKLPALPFDIAIMEKTKKSAVIACDMGWSDVGSWENIWEMQPKDSCGNAVEGNVSLMETENCLIQSNSLLIAALGLKDLVIIENRDCVLIADRKSGHSMKALVETIKSRNQKEVTNPPLENRPWGQFKVLSESKGYKIKEILVRPGKKLSLQMHHRRCEVWTVISGVALVTIDDKKYTLKAQDSISIPVKAMHQLENPAEENLIIIEVQQGDYLEEDDVVRFSDVTDTPLAAIN